MVSAVCAHEVQALGIEALLLDVFSNGARLALPGRDLALAAEQEATIDTLVASGRPVRVIRLSSDANGPSDGLDAETMGGLMMHFMLETIIAADLMGVNPYDQPAVEAGKAKARDYLGDFESLAAKMEGQDLS